MKMCSEFENLPTIFPPCVSPANGKKRVGQTWFKQVTSVASLVGILEKPSDVGCIEYLKAHASNTGEDSSLWSSGTCGIRSNAFEKSKNIAYNTLPLSFDWVKLSINTSLFVTQEMFGGNPCLTGEIKLSEFSRARSKIVSCFRVFHWRIFDLQRFHILRNVSSSSVSPLRPRFQKTPSPFRQLATRPTLCWFDNIPAAIRFLLLKMPSHPRVFLPTTANKLFTWPQPPPVPVHS
ncbi:hypothetical protein CSKR_108744 [Clonorchis sinensis]|uniref:Uncharacterized protein n=1 Tax=Clonorchis sinensis TaxID=79923 RepID=A0A3R7FTH0_CLOSI|nr:hypothetical protein CSKR_108744 [Clonorchis sinensis]